MTEGKVPPAGKQHCMRCSSELLPCFATVDDSEVMYLRAWYCPACQWSDRAIGRERLLTLTGGRHATS